MANSIGTPVRDASAIDGCAPSSVGTSLEVVRDPEKERAALLSDLKVTKGSRFNAAERLRRRDRRNTMIVSFASAYVIILTIVPVIFHVPEYLNSVITLAIIIFSIIILTYSLIQYSSGDPVKAEQHHRCAMELNALRHRIALLSTFTFDTLSTHAKEYDDILQRYNVNHEPVDFERYKIEHPAEYPLLDDKKAAWKDINKEIGFGRNVMIAMSSAIAAMLAAIVANSFFVVLKHSHDIWEAISKMW